MFHDIFENVFTGHTAFLKKILIKKKKINWFSTSSMLIQFGALMACDDILAIYHILLAFQPMSLKEGIEWRPVNDFKPVAVILSRKEWHTIKSPLVTCVSTSFFIFIPRAISASAAKEISSSSSTSSKWPSLKSSGHDMSISQSPVATPSKYISTSGTSSKRSGHPSSEF